MTVRVPQDVDLEDKLVFGLSPLRFGYAVIGIVVAAGVWAAHWPLPLPGLAILPLAAGIGLAVGRWRGHRLDVLAWDICVHIAHNYKVELVKDVTGVLHKSRKGRTGRLITVTALEPGVGTTTIALELAVGLSQLSEPVQLWEPRHELHLRLGLMGPGRHQASGIEVLSGYVVPTVDHHILVRSIPAGESFEPGGHVVFVLAPSTPRPTPKGVLSLVNRGPTWDRAIPALPEDAHIQRSEALRESALVAFPDAPASRTLRALAASLRELVNA